MAEKFIFQNDNVSYYFSDIGKWVTGSVRISKDFLYLSFAEEWIPIMLREITEIDVIEDNTLYMNVKSTDKKYTLYIRHEAKVVSKMFRIINARKQRLFPFAVVYRFMLIVGMFAVAIYVSFNYFLPPVEKFFNPDIPSRDYLYLSEKTEGDALQLFQDFSSIYSSPIRRTEYNCTNYEYYNASTIILELYYCEDAVNATKIYVNWTAFWSSTAKKGGIICTKMSLCRDLEYLRCAEVGLNTIINNYYWNAENYTIHSRGELGINAFQDFYCKKI